MELCAGLRFAADHAAGRTDRMRFSTAATMLGAAAEKSAAVSAASIVRLLIFDFTGVVSSASCAMYSAKKARKPLSSAMALTPALKAASSTATSPAKLLCL